MKCYFSTPIRPDDPVPYMNQKENGIATLEVKAFDNNNVYCADAASWVRFSLAGDGKLIGNQGTSSGSRFVQLYSGRAIIRIDTKNGRSVAAVKSDGMQTVTLSLQ